MICIIGLRFYCVQTEYILDRNNKFIDNIKFYYNTKLLVLPVYLIENLYKKCTKFVVGSGDEDD